MEDIKESKNISGKALKEMGFAKINESHYMIDVGSIIVYVEYPDSLRPALSIEKNERGILIGVIKKIRELVLFIDLIDTAVTNTDNE